MKRPALRTLSTLQWALVASVAAHGALLTVRFVDPEGFKRVFEDTPLEVVLVNARSEEKPLQAKAVAQYSLAGGGDAASARATNPLPASTFNTDGDADSDAATQQLRTLLEQQTLLLAQVKDMLAALPPTEPRLATKSAEQVEREQRRRRLIKLLAEIERRINQENSRPRKRYVSPAVTEVPYALYYDAMRRAIEDRGTEHFPQQDGKKLYGELTMIVTVNHKGQVLSTEIVDSSGNATLDRQASAIARSAAPFGRFSAAMRRQADEIVVVSRFKFSNDETLEAQVSAHP